MTKDTGGKMQKARSARRKGQALIEVTLIAPWFLLLFAGVFDVGFYAYAFINTENAARVAAMHAASDPALATDPTMPDLARADVCQEMRNLPNVGTTCSSSVVQVSVAPQPYLGADGQPATRVSVTYTTVPVMPIPGLAGQMTLTRVVEVRI
jgi:Flp pilus assembly protein TadG